MKIRNAEVTFRPWQTAEAGRSFNPNQPRGQRFPIKTVEERATLQLHSAWLASQRRAANLRHRPPWKTSCLLPDLLQIMASGTLSCAGLSIRRKCEKIPVLELGGSRVLPCSHVCIADFIHHLGVTRKSFKKCIYFSFTTSDLIVAEII